MNLTQFEDLAEAYGGDLRRWPAAHQEDARAFAQTDDGRVVLAQAADFDHLLDASRPALASAALRDRILDSAVKTRVKGAAFGRGLGWRLKAGLGAGLASAGLAGVVAGFALNTAAMEPSELALTTLATPIAATSFGPAPEALPEAQPEPKED